MVFLFFITVNMHNDTKLKLTVAFSMMIINAACKM